MEKKAIFVNLLIGLSGLYLISLYILPLTYTLFAIGMFFNSLMVVLGFLMITVYFNQYANKVGATSESNQIKFNLLFYGQILKQIWVGRSGFSNLRVIKKILKKISHCFYPCF